MGNAVMSEVVDEGRPEGFFEKTHRIIRMQSRGFRDIFDGEWFCVSLSDETSHFLDLV